jgi:pimeloyl-ACP methyl ester carboxylesterase
MASVAEHNAELDGLPVHWLSGPCDGPTPLYVHGVPNSAVMWRRFLDRTGGIAVDLPGFGRSGKPADFDYSITGYGAFLDRLVGMLGLDRIALVMHDWGAVALSLAQARPELVERLVLIDAVPLLPGYRWHRIARAWRTPLLGELAMGATTPWVLRMLSREANVTPGPLPDAELEALLEDFDHGTQRAILKLYRSADPDVLAAAGAQLGAVDAPALIIWGERDPYIPPRFADAYAAALGGPTEVVRVPDAGHWIWLDRPELVDRVAAFVA